MARPPRWGRMARPSLLWTVLSGMRPRLSERESTSDSLSHLVVVPEKQGSFFFFFCFWLKHHSLSAGDQPALPGPLAGVLFSLNKAN